MQLDYTYCFIVWNSVIKIIFHKTLGTDGLAQFCTVPNQIKISYFASLDTEWGVVIAGSGPLVESTLGKELGVPPGKNLAWWYP